MGELVMGVLMPHPPVVVPQIGGNRIRDIAATYDALEAISDRIVQSSPDRLVVISPHSPLFSDAIADWPAGAHRRFRSIRLCKPVASIAMTLISSAGCPMLPTISISLR